MAMTQIVWSLDDKSQLATSSLVNEKELEDLLYEHIEILNESWIVVGRQVRTTSGKFIDLLCMDHDGDMIVVELKKDLTPREVTAQAIDYASCVAQLSIEEIAQIYLSGSNENETLNEAYEKKFNRQLDEETVNTRVKMVIVAAQMDDSTERIIRYLRDTYDVDINILFFNIFEHNGKRLISRVWFEEDVEEAAAVTKSKGKWNGEYYISFGEEGRKWEDARKWGFISAGGGTWYSKTLGLLSEGDRIWVNIPHNGYVGVGIVTEKAAMAKDVAFLVNGEQKSFNQIDTKGNYLSHADNVEKAEYVVRVNWVKTVDKQNAVKELGFFGNQNTVCRPVTDKWDFTVERLKKIWEIA